MVNGHAVGGGWGLLLACDFRFAAAEAQFWIPEVDLGVPLGVASTTRFVRFVGPARAKEIIMGCHRYSAAEAQAMGLVTRVVPGSELEGAVKDYAQHLLKKPFRALAEVKARINAICVQRHPHRQRDDRRLPRPRLTRSRHLDRRARGQTCTPRPTRPRDRSAGSQCMRSMSSSGGGLRGCALIDTSGLG